MLLRVAPDLSELVVWAEQAEQENILGAGRGVPVALAVWRRERPVLLTATARSSQLEPGPRDAVLPCTQSYPRTVSHDGTSVSRSPTEYPQVWCPNIDTLFFGRTLRQRRDGVRSFAGIGCGSGFLTPIPGTTERRASMTYIHSRDRCRPSPTRARPPGALRLRTPPTAPRASSFRYRRDRSPA